MNPKLAESIGLNFVGPHMTRGKVYGCLKLKKIALKYYDFSKSTKQIDRRA